MPARLPAFLRTPLRAPLGAALTAALALVVVLARHSTADRVLGVVLVAVLVPVSLIDIETRRIPNRITGPAAIAAIALGLALKPSGVPVQLLAGACSLGFLLIFAVAHRRGLGMGDVKLAGVLGLYLGSAVAVALFAGLLAAGCAGVVVIARHGASEGRKLTLPLGPFLAFGGVVAVLCGHDVMHWYLHTAVH